MGHYSVIVQIPESGLTNRVGINVGSEKFQLYEGSNDFNDIKIRDDLNVPKRVRHPLTLFGTFKQTMNHPIPPSKEVC
jgi:hypothetical protein